MSTLNRDKIVLGNFYNFLMPLSINNKHTRNGIDLYSYNCKCVCGKRIKVSESSLTTGNRKSCGCMQTKLIGKENTSHNLTKHPLYKKWVSMMTRCYAEHSKAYKRYGGRGIKVSDSWHNPITFVHDMSPFYFKGCEIDRIDNDGDYSFDNCRLVSIKVNQNNRSSNKVLEYIGRSLTIVQWADFLRINPQTIYKRLEHGWSVERTLTQPVKNSEVLV